MPVDGINKIENISHQAQRIADTHFSGKGFFGDRFKTIAPILSLVVLVIAASIFYFHYRSKPKKPDDDQETNNQINKIDGHKIKTPKQTISKIDKSLDNIRRDVKYAVNIFRNQADLVQEQEKIIHIYTDLIETTEESVEFIDNQVDSCEAQENLEVTPPQIIPDETFSEAAVSDLPEERPTNILLSQFPEKTPLDPPPGDLPHELPQQPDGNLSNSQDNQEEPEAREEQTTSSIPVISLPPPQLPANATPEGPPSHLPPQLLASATPGGPPSDLPPPLLVNATPEGPPSHLPPQLLASATPEGPPSDLPPQLLASATPEGPPSDLPPQLLASATPEGPPSDLPRPPKMKVLPKTPKRTNAKQVESSDTHTEKSPQEIRSKTLERTKTAYLNSKNLYKIVKNEKNIAKKTVKASKKVASSASKMIPLKKSYKQAPSINQKKEILGKLEIANKKLENLLKKLKNEPFDTSQKENNFIATLLGIIKTIQFNLQDLEKIDLLDKLSESCKTQYQVLKDKLTVERVNQPKNIESTLTSWDKKIEVRNGFFDELHSAELQFAKDLGIFLNEGGIREKFPQDHDFLIKYEKIHKASIKMAKEFQNVKQEKTNAEKMAKVALIFQSAEFKQYVLVVKEYFPYASSKEILNQGIELRALTLATTRLPLYPLLIETAITLTPRDTPESVALISSLRDIRQQLEFLM